MIAVYFSFVTVYRIHFTYADQVQGNIEQGGRKPSTRVTPGP